jgi:hypothetical protein
VDSSKSDEALRKFEETHRAGFNSIHTSTVPRESTEKATFPEQLVVTEAAPTHPGEVSSPAHTFSEGVVMPGHSRQSASHGAAQAHHSPQSVSHGQAGKKEVSGQATPSHPTPEGDCTREHHQPSVPTEASHQDKSAPVKGDSSALSSPSPGNGGKEAGSGHHDQGSAHADQSGRGDGHSRQSASHGHTGDKAGGRAMPSADAGHQTSPDFGNQGAPALGDRGGSEQVSQSSASAGDDNRGKPEQGGNHPDAGKSKETAPVESIGVAGRRGDQAERLGAWVGPLLSVNVVDTLDQIVNPNAREHPILRGAMDNMAARGEAIVHGFIGNQANQAQFEHAVVQGRLGDAAVLRAEQIADVAKGTVVGFGRSLEKAGNALGDIAYYGSHMTESGAGNKLGSAVVDGVLETTNIVTTIDGAVGLAAGGVAAASRLAAREGAEVGAGVRAAGAQTTESTFAELAKDLASVPEAEGPLAPGHHGPGIGGLSGEGPPLGTYARDGGHHPLQGAYYERGAYGSSPTIRLSGGEHQSVHRVTDAMNRGLHGAEINKSVGPIAASADVQPFGQGQQYSGAGVEIKATGDGTRAAIGEPPAQPWTVEVGGFYGLRASGSAAYGTTQGALDTIIKSIQRLESLGADPIKVPKH